jgi:hypothetical protein
VILCRKRGQDALADGGDLAEPPQVSFINCRSRGASCDLETEAGFPMGNEQERNRIEKLDGDPDVAIKKSLSGEFDGDEYGEGFCAIYTYGPSANRLL